MMAVPGSPPNGRVERRQPASAPRPGQTFRATASVSRRLNCLRHTFATRLVNLDVPVTTIQRLLGHHDLRTTQRYAHVLDKTAQQQYHAAMARIEQALSLAPVALSALAPPLPERAPTASAVVTKDTLDNSM